ncbi:alpha/beta hydrolase [Phreatobacter aquaticus]|uniref:Alpha/beta hydrolase n=1 Tax=Phreatobacter aquaticus TaxID=2570229 RepID=A0A4D7QJE0_9HYPH|nr:alpha/beta hydrolase [Phreatobacter aquaticus]QCK86033.1 alpha/beta hydrolase [Phreatobacter aquaticus]
MSDSLRLDPSAFDPAHVPADQLAVNAAIIKRLQSFDNWSAAPAIIRQMRREGRGAFPAPVPSPRATTMTIDGKHGPIGLRILGPENPKAVYLHIHGGGWTLGTADGQDQWYERFADRLGITTVSVDYRLGPEDPYPMGPDDCETAALWLVAEAQKRFGTDRLLIGGESAGAHLSVVTLLRLRDRHGIMPFCGANLHAGCYDLGLTPSARNWGTEKLVLNTRDISMFVRHFLVRGGDVCDPDISPLWADLKGMPPALFTVGSSDLLVDDTLFMAPRWVAAGNAASLEVYPGGCHVFIAFPGQNSDRCLDRIEGFMQGAIAA